MSFLSDDVELEGDVEDFEGDADLNEWAAMGEDACDILVSKLPQQSPSQDVNKQKQNPLKDIAPRKPAVTINQKQLNKGPSERDKTKQGTGLGTAKSTNFSKSLPKTISPWEKDNLNNARTIGSPGYTNSKPGSQQIMKSQENVKPLKRIANSDADVEEEAAKTRRTESDILMAIEDSGKKSVSKNVVEDKDHEEEKVSFSQDDLRSLDTCLVSEMMGGVKKQMFLRMAKGDRFVVTFAPVELADLADRSVQQIIESQPNLAFFFNRQGKFKKKKGYAQAYFTLTSEVRKFLDMLLYVKLSEQSTEVSVSAIMNGGKHNVQVSFILSSINKGKLIELVESREDLNRSTPLSPKASFQLEKVSTEATSAILLLLFPYATNINFNSEQAKDVGPGYKGPVDVCYLNQQWMDAMMACCSDFRYNGVPLNILKNETQKLGDAQKSSLQSRKDDKRLSSSLEQSEGGGKVAETIQGAQESSRSRHSSSDSNTSGSGKGNDDISNMTLDVCAGMMESLDKLKQMGTDNPNVLKILEMQSQLAALQKSLKKKNKQAYMKSSDGPCKITSPDFSSESETISDQAKGTDPRDRLLKEEKKKWSEKEKDERNKKEVAMLEAKIQQADEKEKDRELRLKAQVENERLRNKELEETRKKKLAKEMIEEARQNRPPGSGTSEAAQKILQSIADKRRDQKQNEEVTKIAHQKQTGNDPDTRNFRQWNNAPAFEPRGQIRNQASIQDSNAMTFEDSFQQMTPFIEGFPGRGVVNKPLTSTPRSTAPEKIIHLHKRKTDDDNGLHSRLEEFQKELAQQGVVSPVKAHENCRSTISPDRPLHEGAPVYTEKEYHRRRKIEFGHQLPQEFYIQTTFLPNRRCPVYECPTSKIFKTEPMFLDHWDMFHKSTMSMRFCHRCTAYFVHPSELHAHLMKAHSVGDHNVASSMVAEARMKIVNNPSYRDPGRFLAPPI